MARRPGYAQRGRLARHARGWLMVVGRAAAFGLYQGWAAPHPAAAQLCSLLPPELAVCNPTCRHLAIPLSNSKQHAPPAVLPPFDAAAAAAAAAIAAVADRQHGAQAQLPEARVGGPARRRRRAQRIRRARKPRPHPVAGRHVLDVQLLAQAVAAQQAQQVVPPRGVHVSQHSGLGVCRPVQQEGEEPSVRRRTLTSSAALDAPHVRQQRRAPCPRQHGQPGRLCRDANNMRGSRQQQCSASSTVSPAIAFAKHPRLSTAATLHMHAAAKPCAAVPSLPAVRCKKRS